MEHEDVVDRTSRRPEPDGAGREPKSQLPSREGGEDATYADGVTRKRVLIHDYTGHPFQVQLSRALASRGHSVLHLYCGSFATPRGRLVRLSTDPSSFAVEAVHLSQIVDKRSLLRRHRLERRYGRLLRARAASFNPDVVLSANTPLEAQAAVQRWCRTYGRRFVYWVQDLYGVGVRQILARRVPVVGALVGRYFELLERRIIARSDRVVMISQDFATVLGDALPKDGRSTVIENWAPLEDVPLHPQDNPWSRAMGLAGHRVLLYAGTLGMKHNPAMLIVLAERFKDRSDVRLIVISTGPGADWVREEAKRRCLENVVVMDFQPFERMAEVLATATVLLVLLESDAGVFSVPSKVLTYLCAGRPQLGAMPLSNAAARTILQAGAGYVVEPADVGGYVSRAEALMASPDLRVRLGQAGRAYAERTFDIRGIADRFEGILISTRQSRHGHGAV